MSASLGELARLFLRLGTTAFGGPAAHIAMMEDQVVRQRGWISREEFLDLVAACNLIPGPNSTELAIHIGHRKAGWRGLLVAGACFILPAALIVGAIAWAYVRWGALPEVGAVLYGVKPVIIAVVALAIWRLARTAVKTWVLGAIAVVSVAAVVAGVNELVVLLGAGVLAMAGVAGSRALAVAPVVPLVKLFGVFAKIGAVLFGSGYVLLAFLRSDLVDRLHWLSESQLLDAIAVGQITPGPVFTTATFVGYVLHGGSGAVVATLGIFAPAFVFVAVSGPLVPRLRRSRVAGAFLDGVVVASLALMGVVAVQLGHAAIVDVPTIVIAIASLAVLMQWPNRSLPVAAVGAVVGVLLHRL